MKTDRNTLITAGILAITVILGLSLLAASYYIKKSAPIASGNMESTESKDDGFLEEMEKAKRESQTKPTPTSQESNELDETKEIQLLENDIQNLDQDILDLEDL